MAYNVSKIGDMKTELSWGAYSADSDIIKVDRLGARSVHVTVLGRTFAQYSATNFARIYLRESDEENAGFSNVHQNHIEGSELTAQGVLLEQKTGLTGDTTWDFEYLGEKRFIVVRFDRNGSLSNARWGAAVTLSNFYRQPV